MVARDEVQEQLDYILAQYKAAKSELATCEQRLALTVDVAVRAERDRDEYREQVHRLTLLNRQMTSAASSAAATVLTALDRVEELTKVVDAAVAWHAEHADPSPVFPDPDCSVATLIYAIVEHNARVAKRKAGQS